MKRKDSKRVAAAKKGWKTRKKEQKRALVITHMIRAKYVTREKGKARSYTRDILVPAKRGTSLKELKEIARETVTGKKSDVFRALAALDRGQIEVTEGPKTKARKAQLR